MSMSCRIRGGSRDCRFSYGPVGCFFRCKCRDARAGLVSISVRIPAPPPNPTDPPERLCRPRRPNPKIELSGAGSGIIAERGRMDSPLRRPVTRAARAAHRRIGQSPGAHPRRPPRSVRIRRNGRPEMAGPRSASSTPHNDTAGRRGRSWESRARSRARASTGERLCSHTRDKRELPSIPKPPCRENLMRFQDLARRDSVTSRTPRPELVSGGGIGSQRP